MLKKILVDFFVFNRMTFKLISIHSRIHDDRSFVDDYTSLSEITKIPSNYWFGNFVAEYMINVIIDDATIFMESYMAVIRLVVHENTGMYHLKYFATQSTSRACTCNPVNSETISDKMISYEEREEEKYICYIYI